MNRVLFHHQACSEWAPIDPAFEAESRRRGYRPGAYRPSHAHRAPKIRRPRRSVPPKADALSRRDRAGIGAAYQSRHCSRDSGLGSVNSILLRTAPLPSSISKGLDASCGCFGRTSGYRVYLWNAHRIWERSNDEARSDRHRKRGHFGRDRGWSRRIPSPIAATTLLKTFTHKPIPPKAAARFAVRAFCALLRFPTRTVRKPQAVATSATIEPSHVRIDISEREEFGVPPVSRPSKLLFRRPE